MAKRKIPAASCYDCFHNNNAGTLKEPICSLGNGERIRDRLGDGVPSCSDWEEV